MAADRQGQVWDSVGLHTDEQTMALELSTCVHTCIDNCAMHQSYTYTPTWTCAHSTETHNILTHSTHHLSCSYSCWHWSWYPFICRVKTQVVRCCLNSGLHLHVYAPHSNLTAPSWSTNYSDFAMQWILYHVRKFGGCHYILLSCHLFLSSFSLCLSLVAACICLASCVIN